MPCISCIILQGNMPHLKVRQTDHSSFDVFALPRSIKKYIWNINGLKALEDSALLSATKPATQTATSCHDLAALVASDPCEAVRHSCWQKLDQHHHLQMITFQLCIKQAFLRIVHSAQTHIKKTKHISHSNLHCKSQAQINTATTKPIASVDAAPLCWKQYHPCKAIRRLRVHLVVSRTRQCPPTKASHFC